MPEWIWLFIIAVTTALFLLVVVVMILYHRLANSVMKRIDTVQETLSRLTETDSEMTSNVTALLTKLHQDAMKAQVERRPRAQDERG